MEQNNKNSSAVQIGSVVINSSITKTEVEVICKGIFYDNFIKMREEAKNIVDERINKFTEELLGKFEKFKFENFDKFRIPDIQYNLYQAQNAYVRVEDETIRSLVVDMIVGRIAASEESNLQLNYNEAISLLPKLNKKHLDILTFIFFLTEMRVSYLKKVSIPKDEILLIEYLEEVLSLIDFEVSRNDLRYMYSAGCGTEDFMNSFESILTEKGTQIFEYQKEKGFTKIGVLPNVIVNEKVMTIREYIVSLDGKYEKIFEVYNEKKLCNFHLSLVAALIASKNLELKKDYKFDEMKWFG